MACNCFDLELNSDMVAGMCFVECTHGYNDCKAGKHLSDMVESMVGGVGDSWKGVVVDSEGVGGVDSEEVCVVESVVGGNYFHMGCNLELCVGCDLVLVC